MSKKRNSVQAEDKEDKPSVASDSKLVSNKSEAIADKYHIPEYRKFGINNAFYNYLKYGKTKSISDFLFENRENSFIDLQKHLNHDSNLKQLALESDIYSIRKKLNETITKLIEEKNVQEKEMEEFKKLREDLQAKEKIHHILSRVSDKAKEKIIDSHKFQELFGNAKRCKAVVVSIDIRRSTELMLKSRSPELFSNFITELSRKLSSKIVENYGIFDKFTGDGILAFFPQFYSGDKAIIWALKAAHACHLEFENHYRDSKTCFNVFIKDIGLGIGIDFGDVSIVNSNNVLSVVGIPVVYACRFSGAKAGETLLNLNAKEEVERVCLEQSNFAESEIFIKNEGLALGYNVWLHEGAYITDEPDWDVLVGEFTTNDGDV